ncbi:CRISPR-associated RAMP Csm3 [Thioalkalivibrio nitratireducens DSM 14787]|uniref:CRISPR system Cms endoribonuclease Csm3 n=2 Tax=Thioalkalivibrio TaxID=106633 RepID=W0DII0_9GAMM|nr:MULTISPECIES: type III-A CRISPR-associated RAMP protein Csm3 [Thioalkalivibrio]AGA33131.1 CRISPR-associated RAMP Csm3 [Thioalkalivibrio nitratireducens DSM 14787]AHE98434.1 CRISPR-associated protein [Thioalkalivibrio paradoxus ARh 1]
MQLTHIGEIRGQIELISGLHIGSGNTEMHIGGTDNPVIKNPFTHEPYIPGSSLKGKMRSLLEWRAGVVEATQGKPLGFRHLQALPEQAAEAGRSILKLFGGAPEGSGQNEELIASIGPTRLAFWDCDLDPAWVSEMGSKNLLLTETKFENMIDRIKGVADNPRNTERVPAGARFDFRLTLKVIDGEDLMPDILRGLRLLELTGIGGSGSRGYGKLRFNALTWDGQTLQDRLASVAV